MNEIEFKIGDTVWFANGKENLSSGTLIDIIDTHREKLYLIECVVPGIWESYYEVRTYETLSEDENKPLIWLRKIFK